MENIGNKTDGITTLPDTEFNSHKNELQNAVVESGQSLAIGETDQLRRAMQYYGRSLYCKDTGAVDAYVLTKPSATSEVKVYFDGLTLIFDTANANTGASTINLDGIGVKKIRTAADAAISAGDIAEGEIVLLVYNSALDSAAGAFELKVLSKGSSSGNFLINGDMRISQRGDFTSAAAATNGAFYLDRWATSLVTVTANKQHISTAQPTGTNGKSLKYIATSTASGRIGCLQTYEEFALLEGKTITFSAWVKSNSTDARLRISAGGAVASTSHSGGGGWEKLSVTHTVSSISSAFLFIRLQSSGGSDVSIDSGDYIEFTQAQLEVGSVATDFVMRSYGAELDLCLRFGEAFPDYGESASGNAAVGHGFANATTEAYMFIPMATKRDISALSLVVENPGNYELMDQSGAAVAVTAITLWGESTAKLLVLRITVASGLTQFRPYNMRGDNTEGDSLIFVGSEL